MIPNEEERKAIKRLQNAADKMPETLWLFAGGSLCVMRYGDDGCRALTPEGAMDQNFIVGEILGIETDGGDW